MMSSDESIITRAERLVKGTTKPGRSESGENLTMRATGDDLLAPTHLA